MFSTISSPHQMDGRLLVKIPGEHLSRFEVTDIVRDGASLVLECEPRAQDAAEASIHSSVDLASHFAVTEVVQEGASLVVQCQSKEAEKVATPRSRQDDPNHVFYPNPHCEGLSHHDPRLFYEDLR
jgi:hypothetical protein